MIVPITSEYRVVVTRHNNTLEKFGPGNKIKQGPKKGQMSEDTWAFVGYYPNIPQCLKAVIDLKLMGEEYDNLNHFLDVYEKITQRILSQWVNNHAKTKDEKRVSYPWSG